MDWKNLISQDWTLFLDRDGVINKRIIDGYVTNVKDFIFLPGVVDAIKIFNDRFKRIFVVTNQQGVGKGLMKIEELTEIHNYMVKTVRSGGGRIDKIYSCPQLKSEEDNYRKPSPRMAFMAKEDFPEIDLSKSIMIGDTNSDIVFGKNAGMKTIQVGKEKTDAVADDIFDTLYDFAKII